MFVEEGDFYEIYTRVGFIRIGLTKGKGLPFVFGRIPIGTRECMDVFCWDI